MAVAGSKEIWSNIKTMLLSWKACKPTLLHPQTVFTPARRKYGSEEKKKNLHESVCVHMHMCVCVKLHVRQA